MPLVFASGTFVFFLFRALVIGEISTVSKGYRVSSNVYTLSESPISFVVALALYSLLAALIVFVTVLVGKRVVTGSRPR